MVFDGFSPKLGIRSLFKTFFCVLPQKAFERRLWRPWPQCCCWRLPRQKAGGFVLRRKRRWPGGDFTRVFQGPERSVGLISDVPYDIYSHGNIMTYLKKTHDKFDLKGFSSWLSYRNPKIYSWNSSIRPIGWCIPFRKDMGSHGRCRDAGNMTLAEMIDSDRF